MKGTVPESSELTGKWRNQFHRKSHLSHEKADSTLEPAELDGKELIGLMDSVNHIVSGKLSLVEKKFDSF